MILYTLLVISCVLSFVYWCHLRCWINVEINPELEEANPIHIFRNAADELHLEAMMYGFTNKLVEKLEPDVKHSETMLTHRLETVLTLKENGTSQNSFSIQVKGILQSKHEDGSLKLENVTGDYNHETELLEISSRVPMSTEDIAKIDMIDQNWIVGPVVYKDSA